MMFRKMNKSTRNRNALDAENVDAVADIEKRLAELLANGTIKEGSRLHLEAKREIKKTRDSINLSRRRTP